MLFGEIRKTSTICWKKKGALSGALIIVYRQFLEYVLEMEQIWHFNILLYPIKNLLKYLFFPENRVWPFMWTISLVINDSNEVSCLIFWDDIHVWTPPDRSQPYHTCICHQHRPINLLPAQPDQDLSCLLTEASNSIHYSGWCRLWSNCTDMQADLCHGNIYIAPDKAL